MAIYGTTFGFNPARGMASRILRGFLVNSLLFWGTGKVVAAPLVRPWQPDSAFPHSATGIVGEAVWEMRTHDVGEVHYTVTNSGGYSGGYMGGAALWFGCIRGVDTLVVGNIDIWPWKFTTAAPMSESSSDRASKRFDPAARADQQFYAVYSDTPSSPFDLDPLKGLPIPAVGIEVHQTSYAWAGENTKRFILVDCWIKNISGQAIENGAVGLFVDGGLGRSYEDDLCGLLRVVPSVVPGYQDTMDIVWIADNDGDQPDQGSYQRPVRDVLGVRILRAPKGGRFNFNWWANFLLRSSPFDPGKEIINWGPGGQSAPAQYVGSPPEPWDYPALKLWYQMMVNGEIDYDQVYSAFDMTPNGWNPPLIDTVAGHIASGLNPKVFLSYRGLDPIPAGDSVPFSFAFMVGANFHRDLANFKERFDPKNPKPFLDRLDFSDLIVSARWADWILDNPGVDSDTSDGIRYRGEAHPIDCVGADTTVIEVATNSHGCDSVFYKGDGVADIRGPQLPLAPRFQVITKPGQIILHWDGSRSETARDPLTSQRDLEGYRVYLGRSNRADQLSLVANWDVEDFKRIVYDTLAAGGWRTISYPYSTGRWRSIIADSAFDPRAYLNCDPAVAYRDFYPDTLRNYLGEVVEIAIRERLSCWAPESNNHTNRFWADDHWVVNPIQRVDERDTVIGGHAFKYGIYEATIPNLQPSIPLYVAVTAVSFGDFALRLGPLESPPADNYQFCQPVYSADVVADSGLRVSVYPNPYKLIYDDALGHATTYFREGYEAKGRPEHTEFDRRVHFINLPDSATIEVYSLDGDLIRRIRHPDPILSTYSSECSWDLISRNAMAVVSGIYIYKVTSKLGTQVGKIVVIK